MNGKRNALAACFLAPFVGAALSACATNRDVYFHSFSFDTLRDAARYGVPDVEVLDYAYGANHQFGTRPSKEARELSHDFPRWSITGSMHRGEFLYVKWRVNASGVVYEERVDLTKKLPADMTGCAVHFVIDGSQLYVFLLPPPGDWTRDIFWKPEYRSYRQAHQIFP